MEQYEEVLRKRDEAGADFHLAKSVDSRSQSVTATDRKTRLLNLIMDMNEVDY